MQAPAQTIEVIYENGVLKPVDPLEMPEGTRLQASLRRVPSDEELDRIYQILSQRFDGGDPLASERHNEHQP